MFSLAENYRKKWKDEEGEDENNGKKGVKNLNLQSSISYKRNVVELNVQYTVTLRGQKVSQIVNIHTSCESVMFV